MWNLRFCVLGGGGGVNAGVDGEDYDILFSIDEDERITNITIERASIRTDLSLIKSDDSNIIVGRGQTYFTASGLARKLGVSRLSIQFTIKKMKEAGASVGTQDKPGAPVLLSQEDVHHIK